MSAKDLFGDPNETLCDGCGVIYKSPSRARNCMDEHAKKANRDRARAFAVTGVSQIKKPEVKP